MERLVWLESAITDLGRLRKFIDKNNPNAAKRAAETIKKAVSKLIEFPLTGKPVTNLIDYRDLYIRFGLSGYIYIVNSGGFGARSDGATPICNRQATSDDVTNFSSIDYTTISNI